VVKYAPRPEKVRRGAEPAAAGGAPGR
jgi:hypothetical protein